MKLALAACALLALLAVASAAGTPSLQSVVILTRHGVRSPTWEPERLRQFSAASWPDFGVPPGFLTPRGRTLMERMGAYYREWLTKEQVIEPRGCASSKSIYIWADNDQRTLETGRALSETLLPGCGLAVHSLPEGQNDPLFDPMGEPLPAPDLTPAVKAHQPAFRTLNHILMGDPASTKVDTLNTASTLSEVLLLEYANGFSGQDLGWGRLTEPKLLEVLELHTVYADLTRRAKEAARARGRNMLSRIVSFLGAGDSPERVLVISGHDTNVSNISGLLDLRWHLPGHGHDDTPPGGALVFSLWREPDGRRNVRVEYVAQTFEQMRALATLTLKSPPASQVVATYPLETFRERFRTLP